MSDSSIIIRGAREHNLRNVDVEIPRDKLVVITGLSGSGKSSLAFDTIYAEGQRRYVESLSSYARQFLGQMDKPDLDSIDGLSPAVSIDQKTTSKNPRSTVGTVTEIYDYLRLLFARVGTPHCPECGRVIERQTTDQVADKIMEAGAGRRAFVLAPVVTDRKGEFAKLLDDLRREGFSRVRIDGEVRSLDDPIELDKKFRHSIEVVVDRVVIREGSVGRIAEAVERATQLAAGRVGVYLLPDRDAPEGTEGELLTYSLALACPEHGHSIDDLQPRDFSFNAPYGACPECDGLGFKKVVDAEALSFSLAYALERVASGHTLPEPGSAQRVDPASSDEVPAAPDDLFLRSLRGLLSEAFCVPQERRYAGALVFAQRTTSVGLMHRGGSASDDEAALISRDLIAALRELHVIDEAALQHLIDGLTTHLRAAIYRCRNNIQVESELPRQIMVSISLLYDFTREQMRLAEQRYGISLNEAEIAYVAMYLDAIYESSARESVVLQVLFVCPFGLASSSVLMTRLSYALAECNVVGPMTEDEARDYVARNAVDLVVSTTDCRLDDVPVVTVDPLLRQSEIERVKSQIMQLSYSKICSYFLRSYSTTVQDESPTHYVRDFVRPENVRVGVDCDDWREAIRIAARPLLARGLVDGHYVDRMISAVEDYGPYMVLTPRTAYVHAGMTDGARENCASVLVLSHDIPFGPCGEKRVRCIVVLGIHDAERSLLLGLAPIFEREQTIKVLGRPDVTASEVLEQHD